MPTIPYGRQSVDDADIRAVVEAVSGDWLTQGPAVERFEDGICEVTGAAHAVAFSSGTAALHGAATVADLGPGSLVGVPSLTFAASAACAVHVGATPVLVDIDPETLNVDLDQVPEEVEALVAVHYAGLPVRLDQLGRRPRVIIEDAAHALGASTPAGPVGGCAHSDLCCFSFHPVKPITTGEGGAVTTNDPDLAARLRSFRTHGTVPTPERGPWAYDVVVAGFNYRLSDIHAALGTSQLVKLDRFIDRRNELAERYRTLLAPLPVELPPPAPPGSRHGYHLFPIRVERRDAIYLDLRARGIGVQVHYVPLHHHSAFKRYVPPAGLPAAERAYERLLSLPMFPGLTNRGQDTVVAALTDSLGKAQR